MIKRVNSTGRRRIPRDRVTIEVFDGNPRSFNALIDLTEFDGPPDAAIVLEATCAGVNHVARFTWGTLSQPVAPANRILSDLHGENVFFSLKVIDRSVRFGRILGVAENIRPLKGGEKTAAGCRGILPVERVDLGDELWKLDFKTHDVFLLVNERIPEFADRVKFDPAVYALIYPTIIREILSQAMSECPESEDDDERWPALWLRFAAHLHPDHRRAPVDEDADARSEWIDEIVVAFCREHSLREKFCAQVSAGAQGEDAP